MEIIAVDDEKLALESLVSSIEKAAPNAGVHGFRLGADAIAYALETNCDIAFLDIELRGESGLEIARALKEMNPKINIIFTTGYGEYAGDAFGIHASGYVMKPITEEKIAHELKNLRHPYEEKEDRLLVKAFGNFEVFADGQPLKFQYTKAKELLAYLVDRNGALASNQEILATLWEDDDLESNHSSYLKNIRKDLMETLAEAGHEDVLVRQRGKMGIVPDKISCDYFDYLNGENMDAYRGEYMTQYSWSELTHGLLF
ncbi:MAG: response regulator [Eubacterium sp.]|nr:response regulator [Eubacterium sp.]